MVRACHDTQTPFVARGAGSGLSGGALPVEDGIVIGLSRLRRVLEVDLDNGRVVVEPGVTNTEVSNAVGPTHFYPPDPSSQIVCTIGGNVAENSGGAHCLKYGFTTNYVLGVEAVLTDGTLRARSAAPRPTGPATTCSARWSAPRARWPSSPRSRCASSPCRRPSARSSRSSTRPPQAGEAVSAITRRGRRPGRDRDDGQPRHPGRRADGPRGLPAGRRRRAAGRARRLRAGVRGALRGGRALLLGRRTEVRVAQDDAERQRFWRARKAAFAAMGRIAHAYYVQDGVIPRTKLPEVLDRIAEPRRGVRPARGQRLPRRRRQPAPARLLRLAPRTPSAPPSCPSASSTPAWSSAARSPASTASATTRRSTWASSSQSPTSPRSRSCAARSTRTASRTPAR